MTRLRLVPAPEGGHDLPPRWDGLAVVWDTWRGAPVPMFVCGRGVKPECCERCGSQSPPSIALGRVAKRQVEPLPQWTVEQFRERLDLAARRYVKGSQVSGSLWAFRCPDCTLDRVLDDDENWWVLDDSDYSDEGSHDAAPATLF